MVTAFTCPKANSFDVCGQYEEVSKVYSTPLQVENFAQAVIDKVRITSKINFCQQIKFHFLTMLFLKGIENLPELNYGYIVGLWKDNVTENKYLAYFNSQPYHSPPVALNMLNTALLRAATNTDATIHVSNHPLPYTEIDEAGQIGNAQSSGFNIGFTVSFGYESNQ